MTPLAALAVAGCLAVDPAADRITLAELAPAFGAPARDWPRTPVGFAPAPGLQRVLTLAELRRIAARQGIAEAPGREVCFERRVAPLAPDVLLKAMRASLAEGRIELIDYSRAPAPEGPVEFPRTALRPAAGGAALWSGSVRYGGRHQFPVWARVRIRITVASVVAAADLKPGRPVEAAQLCVKTLEEPPSARARAALPEEIAGRVPLRPIAAGTPLLVQWFAPPSDVYRGDRVRVEVRSGGTVLATEGQAESSGSAGQTIAVRNLDSKKRFFARVEGKGRVSVGL